jgi:hypothetical protein
VFGTYILIELNNMFILNAQPGYIAKEVDSKSLLKERLINQKEKTGSRGSRLRKVDNG